VELGVGPNGIAMVAGLDGHEADQHVPHGGRLGGSHAAAGSGKAYDH
jgi:hypothetical protein